MYPFDSSPPADSLAHARPGERIRIRRVHLSTNRAHCAELGIREGEEVVCLRQTPMEVVVQFTESHTASLDREHARFVEVDSDPSWDD